MAVRRPALALALVAAGLQTGDAQISWVFPTGLKHRHQHREHEHGKDDHHHEHHEHGDHHEHHQQHPPPKEWFAAHMPHWGQGRPLLRGSLFEGEGPHHLLNEDGPRKWGKAFEEVQSTRISIECHDGHCTKTVEQTHPGHAFRKVFAILRSMPQSLPSFPGVQRLWGRAAVNDEPASPTIARARVIFLGPRIAEEPVKAEVDWARLGPHPTHQGKVGQAMAPGWTPAQPAPAAKATGHSWFNVHAALAFLCLSGAVATATVSLLKYLRCNASTARDIPMQDLGVPLAQFLSEDSSLLPPPTRQAPSLKQNDEAAVKSYMRDLYARAGAPRDVNEVTAVFLQSVYTAAIARV